MTEHKYLYIRIEYETLNYSPFRINEVGNIAFKYA